jgi:SWI/SNF chromatin-remodeling complex subunit SWI1
MQDPKIMQIVGQNPQAQMIQAAMMAHINEHVAFEYRKQIEQAMGMVLPSEENQKNLTTEQADQIAMMAAQASQQLLQQNKQEAAAQQAQQQAQDPVVQMQQQELQIKMQELQLKAQKQQLDAAAKADQLEIEKSRIMAQKEIAAMQVGANAAAAKDKLNKMQELEGTRMGIDAAKHRAQMQRNQSQQNRSPRDKKE